MDADVDTWRKKRSECQAREVWKTQRSERCWFHIPDYWRVTVGLSNPYVVGLNLNESERFSSQVVSALKTARITAGISKYELAKKSGISQTMIYRLEKGERHPTIVTAHALAKALGKNLGEIVRDVES